MDDLKQSVQNASYEQKDPLLIYKLESFSLFDQLLEKINHEIVSFLNKGGLPVEQHSQVREAQLPQSEARQLQTGRHEIGGRPAIGGKGSAPVRVEKKVGRNEPCPCGSGKKYKNCHGREG
jgi:preprotein translocase subunit SecA